MSKKPVIVCINSGPLMVLAKLSLFPRVFSIYPSLSISEIVYHEVVTEGLSIGAKDAKLVEKFCHSNQIIVLPSKEIKEVSLNMTSELHPGEIETIKMALQIQADYLILDDLDARQVAEINIKKLSSATVIKGTLGTLIELYQRKTVSKVEFNGYLEEINNRRDIWISSRLCHKLKEALEAGTLD